MKNKANQSTLKILVLSMLFSVACPVMQAQNELPDSVITKRINFIQSTLEQDQLKTQYWWYGWLGGYGAATVVQGAFFLGSSELKTRQDMALGAATTFLGVVGQFITPIRPGNETEQLKALKVENKEDQLIKLKTAENLMNEIGAREKLARNWQNHVLPTAVDLGSGLVTWLAFDRSVWAGVGNFAFNLAITESQIWSQPMLARRNYLKYQKSIRSGDGELSFVPRVKWYVGACTNGLAIKAVF
jgi:hypothetical protein